MSKNILKTIFIFWFLIQGISDGFCAATTEKHPLDSDREDPVKSAPLKKAKTEPEASLPPAASLKPFKPETNYDKFARLMKMGPHPIPSFQGITWEDEIREGSRRWVHHFDKGTADDWHRKMVQTVKAFVIKMKSDQLLAAEKNIAVAQITFCDKSGKAPKTIPLKYFFCSGWQAKEAQNLRKLLAEGKLGKPLEDYKEYDLRFIKSTYKKDGIKGGFKSEAAFKEELKGIATEELLKPAEERLVGERRLQAHLNLFADEEDKLLTFLYTHSEQSIWDVVRTEIIRVKKTRLFPIKDEYVIIDICSRYDMCWCCGDIFASCCHIEKLGLKGFVRVSGIDGWRHESPFDEMNPKPRSERKHFPNYDKGFVPEPNTYKPYITHVAAGISGDL
jgi:hypothetical protein